MEQDLQKVEDELGAMAPGAMDEALLDRLTLAVSGDLEQLDASMRATEVTIGKLAPAKLDDGLTGRLEGVFDGVPFPVDEKVVMFPKGAPEETKRQPKRSWLAAAAAVALAGALSAWMVGPKDQEGGKVAVGAQPMHPAPTAIAPAAFSSGVSDASDLGVVWSESQKPMRVVRVTYLDKVRARTKGGEVIELEVPRVEYLVVEEEVE